MEDDFKTDGPNNLPNTLRHRIENPNSTKNKRLRKLLESHGSRCRYCDRETFLNKHPVSTIEHLKSQSNGGNSEWENLAISCLECNQLKGKKNDDDFIYYIKHLVKINKEKEKKMEDEQREAYMFGARMGAEYLNEIGKTDLAVLTPNEVLTFSECMCKNYHSKLVDIQNKLY